MLEWGRGRKGDFIFNLVSERTLAVVSSSLEAGGSGTDNATVFAENSPTLVRLQ